MFLFKIQAYLCKVRKLFATLAKIRKEMKEAGDIAGIALPFAAGTAAFTYLAGILATHSALSAAAFLYASVILLGILILIAII